MTAISLAELVVLVVEPSTTQRHIIIRALHEHGVGTVLESDSGAQALAALVANSPDLVVSTLYLPDMTGTDLIHRIRTSDSHATTPFLLISSETRIRYLEGIRQAGVVGILPKPFSPAELRTALSATLDLLSDPSDWSGELEDADLHVLVVDDSSFSRHHISRVLGTLGISHIDHAEDGVQALEMIHQHLYDFLVTDYNMPHMDGHELIDHIRNDAAQSSLPILMVTSEANSNRLAAVQKSGVSAICDKPFEPAMVRSLVRKIIAG